jgi:hypothetical protein
MSACTVSCVTAGLVFGLDEYPLVKMTASKDGLLVHTLLD